MILDDNFHILTAIAAGRSGCHQGQRHEFLPDGSNWKSMAKPFALIIEDDRDVAALFRHVLDLAGFQTEIDFHGQVACDRLSSVQPDLVLLDLILPGVSGVQILELIQSNERLSHTKVIVITGQPHISSGLSVQPDLVLQKPVSTEQLKELSLRIALSDKSPKAIPLQIEPLDSPTGLYNQPFFIHRIESALRQAKEIEGYHFAVFLFRAEKNKPTTDQAEPYRWESVLLEIADSLRSILRPTDTLARFDKDTFYILIEAIPNGEITVKIANRIQEKLYRNIAEIGRKIKIPLRVGILLGDSAYDRADMVLADAKYALMLAIAQGDEYTKYYYQVSTKNTPMTK
jgi:diguanylate cyclase (GGDEF)-like protein